MVEDQLYRFVHESMKAEWQQAIESALEDVGQGPPTVAKKKKNKRKKK